MINNKIKIIPLAPKGRNMSNPVRAKRSSGVEKLLSPLSEPRRGDTKIETKTN